MSEIESELYPKEFSEADIYLIAGFLSARWSVGADSSTIASDTRDAINAVLDRAAWAVPA